VFYISKFDVSSELLEIGLGDELDSQGLIGPPEAEREPVLLAPY
jgi:hypothetical protein